MSIDPRSEDDLYLSQIFPQFSRQHNERSTHHPSTQSKRRIPSVTPHMRSGQISAQSQQEYLDTDSVRALIRPQDDPVWTGRLETHSGHLMNDFRLASTVISQPSEISLAASSSEFYTNYHTFQPLSASTQEGSSVRSGGPVQLGYMGSDILGSDSPLPLDHFGTSQEYRAMAGTGPFSDTQSQRPRGLAADVDRHQPKGKAHRARGRSPVICAICGVQSRNRSDAKKHSQVHNRDYVCEIPGCKRNVHGFGNVHDLERHKKGVHSMHGGAGWRCSICVRAAPAEKKVPRFWSRKDNMKAHIIRMHQSELQSAQNPDRVIEKIVQESRVEAPSNNDPDTTKSAGMSETTMQTDAISDDEDGSADTSSVVSPALADHPGHDDTLMFMPINLPNQEMSWPSAAHPFQNVNPSETVEPTRDFAMSTGDTQTQRMEPANEILDPDNYDPSLTMQIDTVNSSSSDHSHGAIQHSPTLNDVKRASPASMQNAHICSRPECRKGFPRACELRKHVRRHTKPYFCTFHDCSKQLGSRDDWRRHESTQHFLSSRWLCRHPLPDGVSSCGHHIFIDPQQLRIHLQGMHAIHGVDTLSQLQHRYHLGREGNYSFWCGFCSGVIQQDDDFEGMLRPWEARCSHIASHFDKEHRTIDDWVDVDTGVPRRDCRDRSSETHEPSGDEDMNGRGSSLYPTNHVASSGTLPSGTSGLDSMDEFDRMVGWFH